MRRVIICANHRYPRGSASSNYIQYLSLALKEAGYRVELLVDKNPEYAQQMEKEGGWRGVPVNTLVAPYSKNRILHHLKNIQLYPLYLRRCFAELHLTSKDLIIIFSSHPALIKQLLWCRKKYGIKVAACPVEHFPKESFNRKQYRAYRQYYEHCLPKMDLLFPISRAIRDYLTPAGKPMLILPPMADVREYPSTPKQPGKWQVIFPANGMMKDALGEMLGAVVDLPEYLRNKMQFHLCGVKQAAVDTLLTSDERDRLKEVLTLHAWMEYDELIELYRSMHFLFLAREVNQTTRSNFPSKVPEMLCYGVVPIASRVGDYTDGYLTDGENAIVFDGCDRTACRQALQSALSLTWEEYERMSRSAIATAEQKFDYTVWADAIKQAIEGLYE